MRKLQLLAVSVLGTFILTACGSDADPEQGKEFYKGEQVDPGSGGSAGGGTQYPTFETQPYPEAPYGSDIGSVIPNMTFLGWKNPTASGFDIEKLEEVSFADAYDPTGEKGIKYLYVDGFAKWCPPCKAEFAAMKAQGTYATYRAKGFEFMGAMLEDGNIGAAAGPGPAKPTDIRDWADTYDVEFPLVTDPNKTLGAFFAADAFPSAFIVDARTMRVTDKIVGGDLTELLKVFDKRLAEGS